MAYTFPNIDPLLLALLKASINTANPTSYAQPLQSIPQSLQQGAVQPLPPPDPMFGLNQSPQYLSSTPVEQSLSRGANVRDLSIQSGLANNPEDVYAAGIRNEQPDLIELARAAMARQGLQADLQSKENIAQTEAEGRIQAALLPAQAQGEATIRAAQIKAFTDKELENMRQAGGNTKTQQEAISAKSKAYSEGISKILNNETMALDERVKSLQVFTVAYQNELQQLSDGNNLAGSAGAKQFIDDKLKNATDAQKQELLNKAKQDLQKYSNDPVKGPLAQSMHDYIARNAQGELVNPKTGEPYATPSLIAQKLKEPNPTGARENVIAQVTRAEQSGGLQQARKLLDRLVTLLTPDERRSLLYNADWKNKYGDILSR